MTLGNVRQVEPATEPTGNDRAMQAPLPAKGRTKKSLQPVVRGAVGVAAFAVLAQVATSAGWLGSDFPTATQVLSEMFTLLSNGEFLLDIGWSLYAWALAMVLSLVIAVPLGVLIGSIPVVAKATAVPIEILRTLPSVALIPIFILVLGSDTQMKVVLTLFATVWPILFNTVYGMKDLDPVALATARSFRLPRTAVLRRVVLPSVAPFVLTGVRISAALGLIIVVGSELVAGSSAGIGAYILDASLLGTTTVVLAGSVVTGILGTAVNAGLTILDRILFAWRLKMTAADR